MSNFFIIFETSLLVFDRLKKYVNSSLKYFNYFVLYIKLYNDKNRNIQLNIVELSIYDAKIIRLNRFCTRCGTLRVHYWP